MHIFIEGLTEVIACSSLQAAQAMAADRILGCSNRRGINTQCRLADPCLARCFSERVHCYLVVGYLLIGEPTDRSAVYRPARLTVEAIGPYLTPRYST
jgi:hypothetical protein